MLNRAQAPTRRMLVDPKGLGKLPVFSGDQEGRELRVGVFPNVRGAPAFAAELQDEVTAAAVALGVHDLEDETSA